VLVGMYAERAPIDGVGVAERLKQASRLESVGGLGYLSELQDAALSAANLSYHLTTLVELWTLRRALRTASEVVSALRAPDAGKQAEQLVADALLAFQELLAETEQKAAERPLIEFIYEAAQDLDEHYKRGGNQFPPGSLRTGLNYMDKVAQGVKEDEFVLLVGRPGTGKTALATEIILRNTQANDWETRTGMVDGVPQWQTNTGQLPIGVFSLEMSGKSLARRLLFRQAGVSMGKWNQGFATREDQDRIINAGIALRENKVWIDETPNQTIEQMAAKARRWHEKYGIKLFVLDYVQIARYGRSRGDKVHDLTEISHTLVALKKALRVPWLVLAQMNKSIEAAESWRRPTLSDIKDCDALAADADQVWMLHKPAPGKVKFKGEGQDQQRIPDRRQMEDDLIEQVCGATGDDVTEWPRRVDCYVPKNRNGPLGNVEMLFQSNKQTFDDWHDWAAMKDPNWMNQGERVNAVRKRVSASSDDYADVAAWARKG
jgi:replicative DNA helicase